MRQLLRRCTPTLTVGVHLRCKDQGTERRDLASAYLEQEGCKASSEGTSMNRYLTSTGVDFGLQTPFYKDNVY